MGTISSFKKMGIAVAGAALALGMVGLPSAFADDAPLPVTVSPEAGWVQAGGDTPLTISGSNCTGDNEFGYTLFISSPGKSLWYPVADNGDWTLTLLTKDDDGILSSNVMNLSDATNGGLTTLQIFCMALTSSSSAHDPGNPSIAATYDDVDVAVTGRTPLPAGSTTGTDIPLQADGFQPGETVTFALSNGQATGINPGLVGSGVADENGHVVATINVPQETERDLYTFTVEGQDSHRTFVTQVTIGLDQAEETPEAPATTVMFPTGGTVVPGHSLALLGFGLIVFMGAIATLAIGRKVYQR